MNLYRKYIQIHIQSIMQYKTSFLLTTIGQFLVSFNVFLGIHFMFLRFQNVDGYTYSEILLCFSIILMEYSLAEVFARGFDTFPSMLANGEFDRIMVRPRNEIIQVLSSKIEFTRIGRVLQAIVMFAYGIYKSDINWNIQKVLTIIFMLLGGTIVFFGIFLIFAALCFFTVEGLEFMNVLTDGAREYGKYPVSIYGKRVLQFCTFIVPYSLIQYYPLLFLLDKDAKDWYMFLPLLAGFFILPCIGLWKVGVHRYKSIGS